MNDPEEKPKANPWNSLELAKVLISLLTPVLVAVLGIVVNKGFRDADSAAQARATVEATLQRELEDAKAVAIRKQTAVSDLSKFIYERRVRSDLLRASIIRYAKHKRPDFKSEMLERKKLYDATYVEWNRSTQANLLLIRGVLDSKTYTKFENHFEVRLVLQTLKPIHTCLGKAYETTVLDADPIPGLQACKIDETLARLLDCAYAITDELYKLSSVGLATTIDSVMDQRCPHSPRRSDA